MPRLLTPDTPGLDAAAHQLAQGRLLGLPTETVYGLAADAGQPEAVRRIFAAKGRPADHPLIVHLPPDWAPGVAHHAHSVPGWATALMQAFWPGPLTLIVPRQPGVAEAAAGGQDSVGLRCPAHPAAQAVLQAAQALGVRGVAAPSANRFGRVSPTTAAHVMGEFEALDAETLAVLDGGACSVGIESTIVDATRGRPVLLRPGQITPAQLEAACGQRVLTPEQAQDTPAPRASGTLASHYAPTARVRLMSAAELDAAAGVLLHTPPKTTREAARPAIAIYSRQAPKGWQAQNPHCTWRRMPDSADACAHELFAVLRELDAQGVTLIWVETPPPDAPWDGVRDRLARAAA
ncbi:L-threonylcarbamoyladenylate synthase [Hydrogenophaga soli]